MVPNGLRDIVHSRGITGTARYARGGGTICSPRPLCPGSGSRCGWGFLGGMDRARCTAQNGKFGEQCSFFFPRLSSPWLMRGVFKPRSITRSLIASAASPHTGDKRMSVGKCVARRRHERRPLLPTAASTRSVHRGLAHKLHHSPCTRKTALDCARRHLAPRSPRPPARPLLSVKKGRRHLSSATLDH